MKATHQNTLTIILADDDKDERYLFEEALNSIPLKIELKTFPDGEKLLSYLSKNTKELPDVLFLDVNMPRKGGQESLAEIKKNKKLKDVPVVMYSTSTQPEITDNLYNNGAHYYLPKGGFDKLATSIQQVLALLVENTSQPSRDNFILSI